MLAYCIFTPFFSSSYLSTNKFTKFTMDRRIIFRVEKKKNFSFHKFKMTILNSYLNFFSFINIIYFFVTRYGSEKNNNKRRGLILMVKLQSCRYLQRCTYYIEIDVQNTQRGALLHGYLYIFPVSCHWNVNVRCLRQLFFFFFLYIFIFKLFILLHFFTCLLTRLDCTSIYCHLFFFFSFFFFQPHNFLERMSLTIFIYFFIIYSTNGKSCKHQL